MLRAPCPNCGADIVFRSERLPVVVCEFCRSSVLRDGDALSVMGTAATVPETITPLQLGSTGSFDGAGFELIGRVRWRWEQDGITAGGWTEWLALFADGRHGWLAEAMGRYMVTMPVLPLPDDAIVPAVANGGRIIPGVLSELGGTSYRITDARAAFAVGSDGELPFAVATGGTLFSVDLANGAGGVASVQKHGLDVTVWTGRAVTLQELGPRNLRELEGWPLPHWARG